LLNAQKERSVLYEKFCIVLHKLFRSTKLSPIGLEHAYIYTRQLQIVEHKKFACNTEIN